MAFSPATTQAEAGRCTERELREPVDECLADGRLNPAAVGFSRHPVHRCNLRGRFPRKKRWDYWCVTSDSCVLSITYTDLDYAGMVAVWATALDELRVVERQVTVPLAYGFSQPDTVAGGDIRFDRSGIALEILEEPGGTRLRTRLGAGPDRIEADVLVALPPGHETLSVVIPWDERHFQYTSKHNTRPARGELRIGDRRFALGPDGDAFGCLDYGRGVWPWRSAWNWASASGRQGDHVVGLNLGGKWTDGTGSTENGLCIDGRLHKLSEDLVWAYDRSDWMAPWTIRSPESGRVDLRFEPFLPRSAALRLGLLSTDLHVLFGRFEGRVVDDDGTTLSLSRLLGWAEEHLARW
jgi:hypothetical protein